MRFRRRSKRATDEAAEAEARDEDDESADALEDVVDDEDPVDDNDQVPVDDNDNDYELTEGWGDDRPDDLAPSHKECPVCGEAYLASVEICADDGATLVAPEVPAGVEVQDLLSELYVAADRLAGHPGDRSARRRLDDATRQVARLPPPYGFPPDDWNDLIGSAKDVRRRSRKDDPAASVRAAAGEFRDRLFPLV